MFQTPTIAILCQRTQSVVRRLYKVLRSFTGCTHTSLNHSIVFCARVKHMCVCVFGLLRKDKEAPKPEAAGEELNMCMFEPILRYTRGMLSALRPHRQPPPARHPSGRSSGQPCGSLRSPRSPRTEIVRCQMGVKQRKKDVT